MYLSTIEDVQDDKFGIDLLGDKRNELNKQKRGHSKPEHREYKRFIVKKRAFAILGSHPINLTQISQMNMGEIGVCVLKSDAVRVGQIIDISMGGLSFCSIDEPQRQCRLVELDILVADCGFFLKELPFKIIMDATLPDNLALEVLKMRRIGVTFINLDPIQTSRIGHFIKNYTNSTPLQRVEG